jgi:methylated-DNA-[protein]-cysteine S-methyltransferase
LSASPTTDSPAGATLKKWRHQVTRALEDYFAGRPVDFQNLPLDLKGSPFHLRVWQELRKIPPGETISYQEMARRLGNPKAARAVGQTCGKNPIPLIVPCHRVIAANGALGGYSSGLERKKWLLAHEQANVGGGPGN